MNEKKCVLLCATEKACLLHSVIVIIPDRYRNWYQE